VATGLCRAPSPNGDILAKLVRLVVQNVPRWMKRMALAAPVEKRPKGRKGPGDGVSTSLDFLGRILVWRKQKYLLRLGSPRPLQMKSGQDIE